MFDRLLLLLSYVNIYVLFVLLQRIIVQIVISMLTVLTDIVSVVLVTKEMVNKDVRKHVSQHKFPFF